MKKVLALTLVLSMILALMAGCGSAKSAEEPAQSAAAPTGETAAVPAAETMPAPTGEGSAVDSTLDAPEPEAHPTLSYPVADGDVTFKMLQVYNPNASAVYGNEGDYYIIMKFEKEGLV